MIPKPRATNELVATLQGERILPAILKIVLHSMFVFF